MLFNSETVVYSTSFVIHSFISVCLKDNDKSKINNILNIWTKPYLYFWAILNGM